MSLRRRAFALALFSLGPALLRGIECPPGLEGCPEGFRTRSGNECPPGLNASRLAAGAGENVRAQYCGGAVKNAAAFAVAPVVVVVVTGHLRSANATVSLLYANVVAPARRAGADVAVVYHVWNTVGNACEAETLGAIHARGATVYREDAACSTLEPRRGASRYQSQTGQHRRAMRDALAHAPSPWSLVLRARTDVEFREPLDLLAMACAWSRAAEGGTHFGVIGGGTLNGGDIVFFGTAYVATVFVAPHTGKCDLDYDRFPIWRLGRAGLWRDPGWRQNESAFRGPVPWKVGTDPGGHRGGDRREHFEAADGFKASRVAPLYEYDFNAYLLRAAPCNVAGRNWKSLTSRDDNRTHGKELEKYCKDMLGLWDDPSRDRPTPTWNSYFYY